MILAAISARAAAESAAPTTASGAPWTVVLVLTGAAAVWLLVPPPAAALAVRTGTWVGARGRRLLPVLVVAALGGGLTVLVEGVTLALCLVLLAAASGGTRLVAKMRSRKAAQRTADRVVEVCEALAGELRAGRPPARALRDCVEVWPPMDPVATAAELGGDVVGSLRRLAEEPGASGLAEIAGAWQVAHRAGGSMAPALSQVAVAARGRRRTERLVASELASAQATARLVAVLPVGVLALGSGLGGDPWGFLLRTPAGIGCLGTGLALAYLGLAWIERIASEADR